MGFPMCAAARVRRGAAANDDFPVAPQWGAVYIHGQAAARTILRRATGYRGSNSERLTAA